MNVLAIQPSAFASASPLELPDLVQGLLRMRRRGWQIVRLEHSLDLRDPAPALAMAVLHGVRTAVNGTDWWTACAVSTAAVAWEYDRDPTRDAIAGAETPAWAAMSSLVVLGADADPRVIDDAIRVGRIELGAAVRELSLATLTMVAGVYSGLRLNGTDHAGLSG